MNPRVRTARKNPPEQQGDELLDLLRPVVDRKASDLHLRVLSPPVFRINGALVPDENMPTLTPDAVKKVFDAISTSEQQSVFERDLELDFTYSAPNLARFRVNALRQRGTISLAFRMVPIEAPSIDELGLPQICKELITRPRGLILITGPTGSGKSTTLAAMVNHLNQNYRRNVITVEDPIEYLHPPGRCIIAQRELGDDTRSFSNAVKHALRHDPDVLAIGEIRDLDTMSTAITAAETGHLVLGTLHTTDVIQSIDRIVDMFPYGQQRQIRPQLSQILEAILSQTLVSRIHGGRIAAFEIMVTNSAIRHLIRDEERIYEIHPNMEVSSKEEGMQTFPQALADLVKRGLVSQEDAISKCTNPDRLRQLLNDFQLAGLRC